MTSAVETNPSAYRGRRAGTSTIVEFQVEPNGPWNPLPLRLDLHAHSPTGFEWGFPGSGPAQLALAIVATRKNSVITFKIYQQFKWAIVVDLPDEGWALTGDEADEMIRRIRAGETFHP